MKLIGKDQRAEDIMNGFAKKALDSFPLTSERALNNYYSHLRGALGLQLYEKKQGSLHLRVHCRSLAILERMWNEYCSGHLNTVAEECLGTDEVKKEAGVDTIRLKTTILEEDYMKCRKFLTEISGKLSFRGVYKEI